MLSTTRNSTTPQNETKLRIAAKLAGATDAIADYIAHAQAKKLFLWLSRNEHSPLVARRIKFLTFAWASAM